MISPVLLPALLLLSPSPKEAPGREIYFEQTTLAYANGRPAGPGVRSRVWYSGKRMRLEAGSEVGGPALILRLDQGKALRVDPQERVVLEMDMESLKMRSQTDLAMAGELMGGGEARTAEIAGSKAIAGYQCRGFRISAGSAVMDLYVTREIPLGVDAFAEFLEWSGASESLRGLLGEIRKLPGFPLETRSRITILGDLQETVSTVTKVRLGGVPTVLFEPPAGYAVRREEPAPLQ
jgi:hypothetical protein